MKLEKYVASFFDEEQNGYVLVNGWNKEKTFFTREIGECNLFGSLRTLKTSITKVLNASKKYDLGYENDKIYIDKVVFIIKDNVRYLSHLERLESEC